MTPAVGVAPRRRARPGDLTLAPGSVSFGVSSEAPRFPARGAALAAGLALCVALAYGIAACNPAPEPAPGSDPGADAATGDDWTYVGDAACASCHADLTASTHRTGMGRAVSRFDPATAPEQFDASGRSPLVCDADDGAPGGGYCYQAVLRGDALSIIETHPAEPGYAREEAVAYVIGSGNATRSYMMAEAAAATDTLAAGEYLTEMPLTWYVEREVWDLSPGYERLHNRFDRPITLDCLTCHDARPAHEPSQNFYTDVPLGISCERCHGPASAHVEAFEVGGGAADDTRIVNPATLSPELQLDVCQQCHLTGTTVYAAGQDATTYRPGRPLSSHRALFATEASLEDPEAFGIASHAERLARSACFQQSQGSTTPMTCTTCHDPHVANDELPDDHFNASCQSCHSAGGTAGPADARSPAHDVVCSRPGTSGLEEAMTGDCGACHLRRAGTSDIPHVSFTDHWIRRSPPPGSTGGDGLAASDALRRDTPFRLVEMTDGGGRSAAETDLVLGLATFTLYDLEHALPAYLPVAVARLRAGLAGGAEHPAARVALGRALAEMDSTDAADAVLANALARNPGDADAALWLGETRRRAGRFAEAVAPLRAAVRLAPRYTEARLQLAQALHGAGRTADAVGVLERALEQDPERHAGAWNDLGFYRLQTGDLDGARPALRRAVALDPRLPTARVNLGTALLAADDLAGAAAQFEAALRTDPSALAALGNLGVVRARQNRTADARRAFERLLALSPGDARARAALDALP